MNHIGLFEGIGGFSLAARWMGWKTVAWCEFNPFCQKILKHHFPNAAAHSDIRHTDFSIYRGKCYILTGGFPCQPFSSAGLRKGKKDDRYLWEEMLRAVREIKPPWVVGENVDGILTLDDGDIYEEICTSLEAEGYKVQSFIIPACSQGTGHRRNRVWICAHSERQRLSCGFQQFGKKAAVKPSTVGSNGYENTEWETWNCSPKLPLLAYGLSEKLDQPATIALGNAIVPQVAYQIFRAIEETELSLSSFAGA